MAQWLKHLYSKQFQESKFDPWSCPPASTQIPAAILFGTPSINPVCLKTSVYKHHNQNSGPYEHMCKQKSVPNLWESTTVKFTNITPRSVCNPTKERRIKEKAQRVKLMLDISYTESQIQSGTTKPA